MSTSKKSSSTRVSPMVLALATAAVVAVYGAGFMRTRAAAERLTQVSGRRHPVDLAEVQQVLDVARFTNAPEPTSGATSRPTEAARRDPGNPAGEGRVSANGRTAATPVAAPQAVVSGPSHSNAVAVVATPPAATGGGQPAAGTANAATSASAVASVPAAEPAPSTSAAAAEPPPAPATSASATPADDKAPPKYVDGRFTGWGYCRHGEIQAAIVIEHGRIVSAEITECRTRYSCDLIAKLPPQVVSRQSAEVDFVSGASESADAFYYAIEDALKKAK